MSKKSRDRKKMGRLAQRMFNFVMKRDSKEIQRALIDEMLYGASKLEVVEENKEIRFKHVPLIAGK